MLLFQKTMDNCHYDSNLGYFNYNIDIFNPSIVNTGYNPLEKENPNIFSPIHTNKSIFIHLNQNRVES